MAKKKKTKKPTNIPLDDLIEKSLRKNGGKPQSWKSVVNRLLKHAHKDKVIGRIERMIETGKVIQTKSNRLMLPKKQLASALLTGTVDMTSSGNAYVVVEGMEQDIFIPMARTNRAMDGDVVRVSVKRRKGRHKPEGEIIEVLKRERDTFIGIFEANGDYGFVVANRKKGNRDIFIPREELQAGVKAKDGERVVAKIVDWPKTARNPVGRIIEQLGVPGENDTEMISILMENGFPIGFSEKVLKEVDTFSDYLSEEEITQRKDLRELATMTIDPLDAKDFDDALSIRKLENGHFEVGVHIADVSHYVKPGTALDEEASKRATSVYLVDRVNPMLPERLSNNLCSLRPNEDRPAFSALFEMDSKGKVYKEWFGKSVIHSDRRFTYEEAQEIIEGADGDLKAEVIQLNELALALRKKRFDKGGFRFESKEVRFILDDAGKPVDIYVKERKEAHLLVEDFMLLANRKVASYMSTKVVGTAQFPFVYRVHDEPDKEKLMNFSYLVKEFGYELKLPEGDGLSKALNTFLTSLEGKPEEGILNKMAIRSMAKAIYTTDNIGHYGLSFEYYTHFTSPIRRYPDLMVHRLLHDWLTGKKKLPNKAAIEKQCQHCSARERKATDSEYESIRFKQVEYMQDSVGKEFDGVISGVTTWGIYVELKENQCEGMIRLDSFGSEFLHDKKRNSLYAIDMDRHFQMGDPIRILVAGASLIKRELDFEWVDQGDGDQQSSKAPIPPKAARRKRGKK